MTVLFADLVGFTARAHQLDPEDVLTECFQWSIAPTDQGKGRSCLERGLR